MQELLAARGGQPVILEFAIAVHRFLPLRRYPTAPLQAMQRRIQRSVFHLEQIVRGALDVAGDFVTMSTPQQESAQNDHVQGSLQEFQAICGLGGHGRHSTHLKVDDLPWKMSTVRARRFGVEKTSRHGGKSGGSGGDRRFNDPGSLPSLRSSVLKN